jgi:hypothetical protein
LQINFFQLLPILAKFDEKVRERLRDFLANVPLKNQMMDKLTKVGVEIRTKVKMIAREKDWIWLEIRGF